MFKKIAVVVVVVALTVVFSTSAFAGGTAMVRSDTVAGNTSHTVAWMDESGWEAWALNYDGFADYEIGKLEFTPRDGGFDLIGGYLAYWPDTEEVFALPWATLSRNVGDACLTGSFAGYIPLNGGPWAFLSSGMSATFDAGDLRVGPAAHVWAPEGGPATTLLGIKVQDDCGGRFKAGVRWCPIGEKYESVQATVTIDF